jgi:cytochrome bd-type quinol oxidase subunit 2
VSLGAFIKSASAQSPWLKTQTNSFKALSPTFDVPGGLRPLDPREYLANIIQVILGFLGVLCVLLMIYAGFTWMTASGEKDKIDKASKTMTAAVIGLLIVLAAFAVTVFVTRALIGSTTKI